MVSYRELVKVAMNRINCDARSCVGMKTTTITLLIIIMVIGAIRKSITIRTKY